MSPPADLGGFSAAWAAAIIAAAAVVFAAIQAVVALRKLRLDLFAKRFETWEAINDAIDARRDVCQKMRPETPEDSDGGESLRRFWRLRRQMGLLFPPEVDAACGRVEAALQTYAMSGVTRPERGSAEISLAHFKAHSDAVNLTYQRQVELMALAHPYMRQYGWLEIYGTPIMRQADIIAQKAVTAGLSSARSFKGRSRKPSKPSARSKADDR
ncbi:hypothetical protein Q8W71_30025 [Methylobacterium sp. NEAU 140]|uniref:hypothetical protein n=1 Tax=Methylobacterium sp. NEAU 140 TaxID=3064945 RepID=UPI0027325E5F|nr:hypothetical protein [Methylobacterium sp. NEAU 140]MDP4026839.1 hypothetical protein [Methylobacterium sp. NEAU 140]